jgi:hypothetical protein
MNKFVRYLLGLWAVFAAGGIVLYFWKRENRLLLSAITILIGIIVIEILRERLRRKREGYYVYKRGGADDGTLVYNEEGKMLQLCFNRTTDTIYVPLDFKWKEMMPDWAKERKDEILSRIQKQIGKRLIGKSWSYQGTDRKEHLIEQI